MLKTLNHGGLLMSGARALSASPVTVLTGRGGRSSTSGQTVTIFGATGGMGRYLVNSLGQTGTQLVLPHRRDPVNMQPYKLSSDLGQQHSIYTPDFNDAAALEECVKYSDVVVNFTGSHRGRLHHSFETNNVTVTHRIAQACRTVGTPCFIHMSHINADVNAKSRFFKAKALSEEVVLHELPESAIIIRLSDCFHFYDVFSDYLAQINSRKRLLQKGRTHIYKYGLCTVKQPVFGVDVTQGIANIIRTNDRDRQRLYQFIGPKTYSVHEMMTAITDITFRMYTPKYNPISHLIHSQLNENYIRYQMTSDYPALGLPGLEDVGVTPRLFEDIALSWMRRYRIFWQVWDPLDGRRSSIHNNNLGTGENC